MAAEKFAQSAKNHYLYIFKENKSNQQKRTTMEQKFNIKEIAEQIAREHDFDDLTEEFGEYVGESIDGEEFESYVEDFGEYECFITFVFEPDTHDVGDSYASEYEFDGIAGVSEIKAEYVKNDDGSLSAEQLRELESELMRMYA